MRLFGKTIQKISNSYTVPSIVLTTIMLFMMLIYLDQAATATNTTSDDKTNKTLNNNLFASVNHNNSSSYENSIRANLSSTSETDTNYLTFKNTTVGIEFRYPISWEKTENHTEGQDEITLYLPNENSSDNFWDYVSVYRYDIDMENVSLSDMLEGEIRRISNMNLNNTVIYDPNISRIFANYPSYNITYEYLDEVETRKSMELGTIVNDEHFLIEFDTDHKKFSQYLPVFMSLVNSFKITENLSATEDLVKADKRSRILVNSTETYDFAASARVIPIYTTDSVDNVFLNISYRSLNQNPIAIFLFDVSKCDDADNDGIVIDMETCSEIDFEKHNLTTGSIQIPIKNNKTYNLEVGNFGKNSTEINLIVKLLYQENFVNFENHVGGFEFKYPSKWDLGSGNNLKKSVFFLPIKNDSDIYQENIEFEKRDSNLSDFDLGTVIKRDIKFLKQSYENLTILDSYSRILSAGDRIEGISYSYTDEGYKINGTMIWFTFNNTAYTITYSYDLLSHSDNLRDINHLLQTIEFNRLSSYSNLELGIKFLHPSNWEIENSSKFVEVLPPEGRSIRIGILDIKSSGLYENMNLIINEAKSKVTDFKMKDFKAVSLGNLTYRADFSFTDRQLNQKYDGISLFIVNADKVYVIRYEEKNELYNTFRPAIENIINSIKFENNEDLTSKKDIILPRIGVGSAPSGVKVDPFNGQIYVANYGSDTVSVVDPKTFKTITNISSGSKPYELMTLFNRVYVTNIGSDKISVIDQMTNKILVYIPVGKSPVKLDVNAFNYPPVVFVANRDAGTVSVIGTDVDKVIGNFSVGTAPRGISVNPLTNILYVANEGSNTVSVIDYFYNGSLDYTKTDLKMNSVPSSLIVNPNTNKIYVGTTDGISILDGASNKAIKNISLGRIDSFDINYDSNIIYAGEQSSGHMYVLEGQTNTLLKNITLATGISDLEFDPRSNRIYATDYGKNSMYIINGTTYKFILGITFKINDINGGVIKCNEKEFENGEYYTFDLYTKLSCKAIANDGYDFVSWGGVPNLIDSNGSSPLLQTNLTNSATITAHFNKHVQQSTVEIFAQYKDFFYGVIASTIIGPIVGFVLPYTISHREKKKQVKYLKSFLPLIDDVFNSYAHDKQKLLEHLEQQRKEIVSLLQDGVLNESTFRILNARINEYKRRQMN